MECWIHKDDAWKLQSKKHYHKIGYLLEEPEESKDWILINKIPESAKQIEADE